MRAAVLIFAINVCMIASAFAADITLTWEHPTTREDGSPLALNDIDGYMIYYTINAGAEQTLSVPRSTSYALNDVESGEYSFQISTISGGIEGARSNAIAFNVEASKPQAPSVRIIIERCNASGECTQEVLFSGAQ